MQSKELPFLQSQILDYIYLKIFNNEEPSIKELSEITVYPIDSKILSNGIKSLIQKGFIDKKNEFEFSIPEDIKVFFQERIKSINNQDVVYDVNFIELIDNHVSEQLLLFNQIQSISDLNQLNVVHQWYDYLEDFPFSLLEESIQKYDLKRGKLVLDPFCGSGTTLVSSNFFGLNAIGIDANPLMCFVSQAKTTWDIQIDELQNIFKNITTRFIEIARDIRHYQFKNDFLDVMPKRELNQWINERMQKEVALMKDLIQKVNCEKIRRLLLVILGKSAFDSSYVALCPGTTFYPHRQKEPFFNVFCKKMAQVYKDLETIQRFDNYGKTKVFNRSALETSSFIDEESIDFIITSPPYPNDLEYTRQTRLELYLLDFVKSMEDVQRLKRMMIKGSTKLIYKEDDFGSHVKKFQSIQDIADRIGEALSDKNWGFDYPRMIREYFGGMYISLKEFYKVMKKGSCNLQVVGDQTYKNIVIPVGKIFVELAKDIGYSDAHIELFRTRRSTTHEIPLPEEIVVIKK